VQTRQASLPEPKRVLCESPTPVAFWPRQKKRSINEFDGSCNVPTIFSPAHNHLFRSANRAASVRFWAPSFCMAVER